MTEIITRSVYDVCITYVRSVTAFLRYMVILLAFPSHQNLQTAFSK